MLAVLGNVLRKVRVELLHLALRPIAGAVHCRDMHRKGRAEARVRVRDVRLLGKALDERLEGGILGHVFILKEANPLVELSYRVDAQRVG